jgi:hypothetical protein
MFKKNIRSRNSPELKCPSGRPPPQVENDNLGTQFLNLNPGFLTLTPTPPNEANAVRG